MSKIDKVQSDFQAKREANSKSIMDLKDETLTREEEAKVRTQKFNERIKNNLREKFDKFKMHILKTTPISSDLEV